MNLLSDDDDLNRTPSPKPDAPRVVFKSAYRLTREQESAMIDYAMQREKEVAEELGRNLVGAIDWWSSASEDQINAGSKSFLGRRQIYEAIYENEVEWRATLLGGIFAESNWIVPISRRVVSHQAARANAHFYGTDPWISADLSQPVDPEAKQDSERWIRSKFREAGVKSVGEQANERALIRGEAVLKTAHRVVADLFEAEMTIMVNEAGRPILDSRSEYITPERQIRVTRETQEATPVQRVFGGGPRIVERKVIADDPTVVLPEDGKWRWAKQIVPRRNTLYEGPHTELCYYKDILIPLQTAGVQEADSVFHLYDIPVTELADSWNRKSAGLVEGEEAANIDTANAVKAILDMRGNTPSGEDTEMGERSGAATAFRDERPEDRTANYGRVVARPNSATAKIVECWMRYDFNEDGIAENILLVLDKETETPIYYDYVGNITPDGKRPFHVIRINPVDGRWYGVGSMQIYETIQNICDLQVNRWNRSQGESGRITFVDWSKIVGGQADQKLDLNWGGVYELEEGATADQAVSYVNLPEIKGQDLKELMDFYLQMAFNMSGVQTANDAQMAGLASAKNATSILNIDRAGHEMFGQILSHLETGISPWINALAELAVVNMADAEPYEWKEADSVNFGMFSRTRMGSSRLKLRLLLTKYKAEQEKVAMAEGCAAAVEFYTLPPQAQARLAPLYRQRLRVLDIAGPDSLIQPLAIPEMQPQEPGEGVATGVTTYPAGEPGTMPSLEQYAANIAGGIAGGMAATGAA